MVRLKPDEILRMVEELGFEEAWLRSSKLLPKRGRRALPRAGRTHPLFDIVQELRQRFVELGFVEIANPIIVEDADVRKQYGPEANVILDRCFYLASLPRPDIGLEKDKVDMLGKLGVPVTQKSLDKLRSVLRDYKRGALAADDFAEAVAEALSIDDSLAGKVISEVFPEFKELKPVPTLLTLRSHMTTAWFRTLKALQHRLELPVKLFSIGYKFRREQREDQTHLRSSMTASCVVMDSLVTAEEGKELVKSLLKPLGIRRVKFTKKAVTSRYYAPGTEYEGFAYFPKVDDWIEVANFGMYSPVALARYELEYPVLNVGMGVERICMILTGEVDMRSLVYPQFYAEWTIPDFELAGMVHVDKQPRTREGRRLMQAIAIAAFRHADDPSPCEIVAFDGSLFGRRIKVSVYEREPGAKLLGPAALNEVYVYDGNIVSIPCRGMEDVRLVREARERGVRTGIRVLEAVAALAARKIERAAKLGRPKEVDVRIRAVKGPAEVNVRISEVAQRYVTSKRKRIDFRGPVFIGIKAEIG